MFFFSFLLIFFFSKQFHQLSFLSFNYAPVFLSCLWKTDQNTPRGKGGGELLASKMQNCHNHESTERSGRLLFPPCLLTWFWGSLAGEAEACRDNNVTWSNPPPQPWPCRNLPSDRSVAKEKTWNLKQKKKRLHFPLWWVAFHLRHLSHRHTTAQLSAAAASELLFFCLLTRKQEEYK